MGLPRLELPAGTLLLREELAGGPERSGNARLVVRDDGTVLHARNTRLWADPGDDDDPARHWNTALVPVATLAPDQLAALAEALAEADLGGQAPPAGRVSDPVFERVTVVRDGRPATAVANRDALPAPLQALHERVDAIVDAALRVP